MQPDEQPDEEERPKKLVPVDYGLGWLGIFLWVEKELDSPSTLD